MKKKIICGFILLVGCGYGLLQVSKSRKFQLFGEIIDRVDTEEKVVALTFDDAPNQKTLEVLEILKDKNIKATFFEVGRAIEEYPEIAKAVVEAGMEVGNHSYSHKRFLFKSLEYVKDEVELTNKLIRDSGYKGEITFRPPFGKKLVTLPYYLSKQNIKTIMFDVEPDTYAGDMAEGEEKVKFLVEQTMARIRPGSIILLHPLCDKCESDRKAVGIIIDKLKERGYRFVTVTELVGYK